VRPLIAVCIVIAAAQPMRAAALDDPMRPPEAVASTGAVAASPVSNSGLQIVITSPQRKLAVIDGAVVPLGAPVRKGTLAGVSDSVAVLRKNGDSDVLLMYPNIDKRPSRRTAP
jgi:MSHA biogenesis protein MshK